MTIAKVSTWERPCDIVPDFKDAPDCLEILRFFEKHSYARFNKLAILHTPGTEGRKAYLEKALRSLIEQDFVEECVENGVSLYSLTVDETLRSRAMKLAKLN